MKVSTQFSDSIHLLAFLIIYQGKIPMTSTNIASSIQTSPVVVRRLMSNLRKAGLLKTTHGSADPQLTRDPTTISLLDIYLAARGKVNLFVVDENTNRDCIVGGNIQEVLHDYYQHATTAAEAQLAKFSLQDIIDAIIIRQAHREND